MGPLTNDNSSRAGRVPQQEDSAGTSIGVTAAAVAGEKGPSQSSRASDGTRTADDSGQRSKVSAGVEPMTNMPNTGDNGDDPVTLAEREAPAADPGNRAGRDAEDNSPELSASSSRKKADFGSKSTISNNSNDSRTTTSTTTSSGGDSGDVPALVAKPAWDLVEVFGKLPAIQGGRTRSKSRSYPTGVG